MWGCSKDAGKQSWLSSEKSSPHSLRCSCSSKPKKQGWQLFQNAPAGLFFSNSMGKLWILDTVLGQHKNPQNQNWRPFHLESLSLACESLLQEEDSHPASRPIHQQGRDKQTKSSFRKHWFWKQATTHLSLKFSFLVSLRWSSHSLIDLVHLNVSW